MLIQTTIHEPKMNAFITTVLACDDCRKVAEGNEEYGALIGNVQPFMARRAGYICGLRGSLQVTICPECAGDHKSDS